MEHKITKPETREELVVVRVVLLVRAETRAETSAAKGVGARRLLADGSIRDSTIKGATESARLKTHSEACHVWRRSEESAEE